MAIPVAGVRCQDKQQPPSGNAAIRSPLGHSEIVITTTGRLAGAIHSLTWNGQEFINSADHGRQLQSAANFNLSGEFTSETFNPTEAGSRRDGAGGTSTSKLLHFIAADNFLQTTTQMAFWLTPAEKSADNLAKNKTLLSNHLLTKRVIIGYRDLANVVQYDVTISMPIDEHHTYAQFEAVTGYMPEEFHRFLKFNPDTTQLEPLSDGPGEQAWPVVLSTEDGNFAMGVFSPDQPSRGYERAGYGRFRFTDQRVNKWNCVFRIRSPDRVEPRDYSFRNFVILGDLQMVQRSMIALHKEFTQ